MTELAVDEGGGLATREVTARAATSAEQEARIFKQNRLLRVELVAMAKDACNPMDKDKNERNGAAPTGGGGSG